MNTFRKIIAAFLALIVSINSYAPIFHISPAYATDDGQPAQLLSFTASVSSGLYGNGDNITINANFDEPVDNSSTMQVTLDTGVQVILGGNGSSQMSGGYNVTAGQNSNDLTINSIDYASVTTVEDNPPVNQGSYSIPSSQNLGDNADIVIGYAKLTSFTSSASNGTYTNGSINITANFDRNLSSGSMNIVLSTGAAVLLDNVSGSSLSGNYTIGAGEISPDLTVNSISSASITDSDAGHLQTSYSVPGSPNNISDTSDIVIDAKRPELVLAQINGDKITLTYDEILDSGSVPSTSDFAPNINGGGSVTVNSITIFENRVGLVIASTVGKDDIVSIGHSASGGLLQDINGNDADSFNTSVQNGTFAFYKHASSGRAYWQSVASSGNGQKLAAVESKPGSDPLNSGYLYTSSDYGVTWTRQVGAGLRHWVSIASSADGQKLVAGTDSLISGSGIFISTDAGVTWTESLGFGVNASASGGIAMTPDGSTIAFPNDDGVYVSADGGDTWNRTEIVGSSAGLDAITISDDGTKIAVTGYNQHIYISDDSGATWNTFEPLRIMSCIGSSADNTRIFTSGEGGSFLSINSGTNWTTVDTPGCGYQGSMAVSDDGLTMVYNRRFASVNTSIDGGFSWFTSEGDIADEAFYAVAGSSDGSKIAATAFSVGISPGGYIYTNTPNPPALTSFTSSTTNGTYTTGQAVNIRANFDKSLGVGSTMTIHLNSQSPGSNIVLSNISGSTLSGTYTVGAGDTALDLSVASIVSASVADTAGTPNIGTNYSVPSSPDLSGDVNGNIGDSSNIKIGTGDVCNIPVGTNPYQLATVGTLTYVVNMGSDNVSVIDTTEGDVVTTISVGDRPYGIAYNSTTKELYVANLGSDTVSVIDADQAHEGGTLYTVTHTISVGDEPYYVASLGNKMYVTNNVSNTVSVISTASHALLGNIAVGTAPRGIKAHGTDLYVANFGSSYGGIGVGSVSVIDTMDTTGGPNGTVTDTIIVGSGTRGVTVSGNEVYVANFNDDTVSVINTATNTVTHTISVGNAPRGILTLGAEIYVENYQDGTISIIDTGTHAVTSTHAVGNAPAGFAAVGTNLYISSFTDNTVSILDTTDNTMKSTCIPDPAPTVVLSKTPFPLSEYVYGTFTVTATFSEGVTGVDINDFVTTEGTKSNFTAINGQTFSVDITPADPVTFTVNMPAGAGIDSFGNQSEAADELELTYVMPSDSTAPALLSGAVNSETITLTYSEALDTGSVPLTSAFSLSGGHAVTGVSLVGSALTLSISPRVTYGELVTISYAPGASTIQDTAGNDASAFSSQSLTNNTPRSSGGSVGSGNSSSPIPNISTNYIPQNPIDTVKIARPYFYYSFEDNDILSKLQKLHGKDVITKDIYENQCVTQDGKAFYRKCQFGWTLKTPRQYVENILCEGFISKQKNLRDYRVLDSATRKEVLSVAVKMRKVSTVTVQEYRRPYTDVGLPGEPGWIQPMVETALHHGIISSTHTLFHGDNLSTRSEAYGMIAAATCISIDEKKGERFEEKMYRLASENGLTARAWADFEPSKPISRQELFMIASRAADLAERTGGCDPKPKVCFVGK